MKMYILIIKILILVVLMRPAEVFASVQFGNGYYTNLCGTGTAATEYTCGNYCDPITGFCVASNDGVVRYVCRGNWNQCLENESGWTDQMSLGNPGCGNTVQLSVYDHKCYKEDGSWDNSCQLLGYMTWFSGNCSGEVKSYSMTSQIVYSASPSATLVKSTLQPTNTLKPTMTIKPTLTVKPSTTLKPTLLIKPTISIKPTEALLQEIETTSPATGVPIWFWGFVGLGIAYLGKKMVKIGKMMWS